MLIQACLHIFTLHIIFDIMLGHFVLYHAGGYPRAVLFISCWEVAEGHLVYFMLGGRRGQSGLFYAGR